jgi:hypothetical protein
MNDMLILIMDNFVLMVLGFILIWYFVLWLGCFSFNLAQNKLTLKNISYSFILAILLYVDLGFKKK